MPFSERDAQFLRRALVLARRALPAALGTNPPVGALLARDDRILAEGWHQYYGGPHAEIEALNRLPPDTPLQEATLYVTLEPCCHHGKTPPCTSAIISRGIRRVVIGTLDPNPAVAGGGVARLKSAGLEVVLAPSPTPYQQLVRPFAVSIQEKRPYITLKWAQLSICSHPPLLGSRIQPRYPISTFWGRVWGHRLRSRHSHIAVGYATWVLDKPQLTTRLYSGASPRPVVLFDPRQGLLPEILPFPALPLYPLSDTLRILYHDFHAGSLLVEGGCHTLQAFLSSGLYDEIHILHRRLTSGTLPPAPVWAPQLPPLPLRRRRIGSGEYVLLYRRPVAW